jgi:uncharacterized RDD family membrane protein YckC
MYYAGCWKRFCAGFIDVLVLLVPFAILAWLSSRFYSLALILAVPVGLLYWFYSFRLHAVTGQTVGKRVMKIRIVALDGSRIGYQQSFYRSSVDLGFAVITIVGTLWGLCSILPSEYSSLTWMAQQRYLQSFKPSIFGWAETASTIWVWSEVVTMLFNTKKRAIHDFIAGTIVIQETA